VYCQYFNVNISDVYRFILSKLSLWNSKVYRRNLRVLFILYRISVGLILLTHKYGNHSHAKHWTPFVCLLIYNHPQCRYWVYQNSEAPGAWTVSKIISEKKKANQIRPRGLRVHSWPACLSLYLCGKWLLRNSTTLIKIWHWTILFEEESDTVFLSVWHHPYFHHVMLWVPVIAYSVIRKDMCLDRTQNTFTFVLSPACCAAARGFARLHHWTQHGTRSHCWQKYFCHFSAKCRTVYTIMWFKVLKNFVIHNTGWSCTCLTLSTFLVFKYALLSVWAV